MVEWKSGSLIHLLYNIQMRFECMFFREQERNRHEWAVQLECDTLIAQQLNTNKQGIDQPKATPCIYAFGVSRQFWMAETRINGVNN